jgi:hypothetical protein
MEINCGDVITLSRNNASITDTVSGVQTVVPNGTRVLDSVTLQTVDRSVYIAHPDTPEWKPAWTVTAINGIKVVTKTVDPTAVPLFE